MRMQHRWASPVAKLQAGLSGVLEAMQVHRGERVPCPVARGAKSLSHGGLGLCEGMRRAMFVSDALTLRRVTGAGIFY